MFKKDGGDQFTPQQHFYEVEEGFMPQEIGKQIKFGFIKAFVFNHIWDSSKPIWRLMRGDSGGSLRITNGTQGGSEPSIRHVAMTGLYIVVAPLNLSRSQVIISNADLSTGNNFAIQLKYGSNSAFVGLNVPYGTSWIEDNWAGDIYCTGTAGQNITILEYN